MTGDKKTPKKEKTKHTRRRSTKKNRSSRLIGKVDLTTEGIKKEIQLQPSPSVNPPPPSSHNPPDSQETRNIEVDEISPVTNVVTPRKTDVTNEFISERQPPSHYSFPNPPSPPNQTDSHITEAVREPTPFLTKKQLKRRRQRMRKERENRCEQRPTNSGQSARPTPKAEEVCESTQQKVFYAVRDGAFGYNGVHTDWSVCARYLKGTCGATLKSFASLDEAFEFAHGDDFSVQPPPKKKAKIDKSGQFYYCRKEKDDPQKNPISSDQNDMASAGIQFQHCDNRHAVQPVCSAQHAAETPRAPSNQTSGDHSRRRSTEPRAEPNSVEEIEVSEESSPSTGTESSSATEPPTETQSPEETQSREVTKTPKRTETQEECRIQPWKVEPLLISQSLFTKTRHKKLKKEMVLLSAKKSAAGRKR